MAMTRARRFRNLALLAALVAAEGGTSIARSEPDLRGDYDGSAVIDAGDVQYIFESIGGEVTQEDLDLSRDGVVDEADVQLLLERVGIALQDVLESDAETVVVHTEESIIADESGQRVLPLLTEDTEDVRVLWQTPAAGTVLGLGTMNVEYMLDTVDGLVLHIQPIVVVDRTAPELTAAVTPLGQWTERPQRVPYVVVPDSVTIDAMAIDSVDGLLDVQCELDGEMVDLPIEVTEPGFHWAILTTTDLSGNRSEATHMFEIRTAKVVSPTVTVQSLKYRPGPDGRTIADLYVAVDTTSPEFAWEDLYTPTLCLWGTNSQGAIVTSGAAVRGVKYTIVAGTNVAAPQVDAGLWDVLKNSQEWSARFELFLDQGVTEIQGIFIEGNSSPNAAESFDLQSESSISPSLAQIAADGQPIHRPSSPDPGVNPGTPSGPLTPIVIAWKSNFLNWIPMSCSDSGPPFQCGNFVILDFNAHSAVSDMVGDPDGHAFAVDEGCPGGVATSCAANASGTIFFYLFPQDLPPNVIAEITTRARPEFILSADTMAKGRAGAAAQISISGGGISPSVTGAVAKGAGNPTTIEVGPDWAIPVLLVPPDSTEQPFNSGAPQTNTIVARRVSIEIGSSGQTWAAADAGLVWTCKGFSRIKDSRRNLLLHGEVVEGLAGGAVGSFGLP